MIPYRGMIPCSYTGRDLVQTSAGERPSQGTTFLPVVILAEALPPARRYNAEETGSAPFSGEVTSPSRILSLWVKFLVSDNLNL
jgi:hypothetical protein